MANVRSILEAKGRDVYGVDPDAAVIVALGIMAERNIGAIMVMDKAGEVAGIFSERDFARKIIVKGRTCETTKVREIMTARVVYAEPSTTIADCMNLMTAHKIRHLPVKEAGTVVGVISIGDVVKALIDEQGRIISQQAFEIGQNERTSPGAI